MTLNPKNLVEMSNLFLFYKKCRHVQESSILQCTLTPACFELTFSSIEAYETHYATTHRYQCSQCHRYLPSSHYLDLHLSEIHDSFFAVMAEKQNMVILLHSF